MSFRLWCLLVGIRDELTCQAKNADPKGDFVWTLGDQVLEDNDDRLKPIRQISENDFEQSLVVEPDISLDKKLIACR